MQHSPMKANQIVGLFARLLDIDITVIASVIGNIPRENLKAWLGGKRDNLRKSSILRVLELVGLRVGEGLRLDPTRVHNWHLKDGLFTRNAYSVLHAISPLLEGCAVTRIEPVGRGFLARRTRQVYLLSGPVGNGSVSDVQAPQVRVVVHLRKSLFKRARLGPETIPGTIWRDVRSISPRGDVHTIPVVKDKWELVQGRDIAPHEFDQVFEQAEPKMAWNDVAMLAREYACTPDMVHGLVLKTYGPREEARRATTQDSGRGSMPFGDNVIALPHMTAAA